MSKSSNKSLQNYSKIIKHQNSEKTFHPSLALLRLYASPDPLATSSTHVYRVHDHRQTQGDRVS